MGRLGLTVSSQPCQHLNNLTVLRHDLFVLSICDRYMKQEGQRFAQVMLLTPVFPR